MKTDNILSYAGVVYAANSFLPNTMKLSSNLSRIYQLSSKCFYKETWPLTNSILMCLTEHLTDNIEMVSVVDGAILVFHDARVISFVRWDYALHDETPVLVADLEGYKQKLRTSPAQHPLFPSKTAVQQSFVVRVRN